MRRFLVQLLLALRNRCADDHAIDLTARTLVFAPHPDDEVLGCGGTIARKVLAGAVLRVVIVTDGRTSHEKFISAGELVRMRRAEAHDAATALGLADDCCEFLDFPDGQLHRHREAAVAAVRSIIQSFAPREIYLPHRADRQHDHETTYGVVLSALEGYGQPVNMFEYPIWLLHSWPWTWGAPVGGGRLWRWWSELRAVWEIAWRCRTRSDIAAVRDKKLQALAAYRSQMQRIDDNPNWPVMADVAGGEFIAYFAQSAEMFRKSQYRPR